MIDFVELRLHRPPALIPDPGFEIPNPATKLPDAGAWTVTGATKAVMSTSVRSGNYALRLTHTAATSTTTSTQFPVVEGTTYNASVWCNAASSKKSRVGMGWYSSTGTLISAVAYGPDTTSSGSWAQAQGSFTAPAGAAKAVISAQGIGASSDVFYFDDFRAEPAPTVLDFSNLSFDLKYNDLGVINFAIPLEQAIAAGASDQAEASVWVGTESEMRLVERYVLEGTSDDKVVDGQRFRTLDGRSLLALLYDAVVHPSNWPVTSPAGHLFKEVTLGTIFRTLIARAKSRGVLETLREVGFTAAVDSSGAAWTAIHSQEYANGADYYSLLSDFMQRGLADVWVDPSTRDLRIVNGGQRGAHIPITALEIRPAVNVSELTIATQSAESCSTVLIEGEEGTAVSVSNDSMKALLGRKRERFVSQGGIADAGILTILGNAELETYGRVATEETVGLAQSVTPFLDFNVGDWVMVRYDTDQPPVERRVRQIAVSVSEDRSITLGVTLNSILLESDVALARKVESYTGNGGTYGSVVVPGLDNSVPVAPDSVFVNSSAFVDNSGQYQSGIVVTWAAPTVNTNGTAPSIGYYEVQYKYDSDLNWNAPTVRTSETETALGYSPLNPGAAIKVRVRAVTTKGFRSAWSAPTSHTVASDTAAPPVPSTPTVADAPEYVSVTWNGLGVGGVSMPADFAFAEVWQSNTTGTTPGLGDSKKVGQFFPGGGVVRALGGAYDTNVYIRLVAVDKAGNRSAPSGEAFGAKKHLEIIPSPETPPSSSPTMQVISGIGSMNARWEAPISTESLVYEVHIGTVSGFPTDAYSYVAETPATAMTVRFTRKNLISNPSFEDKTSFGWLPAFGTISVVESDTAFAGDYVLTIVPDSATAPWVYTPQGTAGIPVVPGRTYRFRNRIRPLTAAATGGINVVWFDSSGTNIGDNANNTNPLPADVWTTSTADWTAPAGAAYASIACGLSGSITGVTAMELDYAQMLDPTQDEPLTSGVTYYLKTVAKTARDGLPGPAGVEGSGKLQPITNDDISAEYVYAGALAAEQITAGELSAEVTVSGKFQTATSGQRVEMSPNGLTLYGPDDVGRIILPTGSGEATFRGKLISKGLTIESGLELRGQDNKFAMGSETVLQTKVGGSATSPAITIDHERVSLGTQIPYSPGTGAVIGAGDVLETQAGSFFGIGSITHLGNTYTWPPKFGSGNSSRSEWSPDGGVVKVWCAGLSKYLHVMLGSNWTSTTESTCRMRSYNLAAGVSSSVAPVAVSGYVTHLKGNAYFSPRVGRNVGSSTEFVTVDQSADSKQFLFRKWTLNASGVPTQVSAYGTKISSPFPAGGAYGSEGVVFGTAAALKFHPTDSTEVFAVQIREDRTQTNNGLACWVRVFRASDATRLPNYDFAVPTTDTYLAVSETSPSLGYGAFYSIPRADAFATKYSDITWTTESSLWWAGFSWRDTNTSGIQNLTPSGLATTFTLSFKGETTAALPNTATASQVQTALENLSNISPGDVAVMGGPFPTSAMQVFFSSAADSVTKLTYPPDGVLLPKTAQYAGLSVPYLVSSSANLTVSSGASTVLRETEVSALQTFQMKKRMRFSIATPPLPDPSVDPTYYARAVDDVNGFYTYLGRGAIKPTTANLWKQKSSVAEEGATTYTFKQAEFSGTSPVDNPQINNFPDQASAVLRSSALGTGGVPSIYLSGSGYMHTEALDVGGAGAGSLTGKAFEQLYYSIRAQSQLAGGGTKTVSSSGAVSWSARFLASSFGRGATLATGGYFDIQMPPNGTVIPAFGGATSKTVSGGVIPLSSWDILWYELPFGSGVSSVPGNFRVTGNSGNFVVPNNWILIAFRNNDSGRVEWATGEAMAMDTQQGGGWAYIPAASSAFPSTGTAPQFRVIGDTVYLRGRTWRTSGTDTTGYTLPTHARPVTGTVNLICRYSGSSSQVLQVAIATNGNIVFSSSLANGDSTTNWVSMDNISYLNS